MSKPKYVLDFERECRKVRALFGTPTAHTHCFVVNHGTDEVLCENCVSHDECLEMLQTLKSMEKGH